MSGATLESLRTALVELDEQPTLDLTRELLAQGRVAPVSILSTCQQALKVVGERYERQEYFISGLIMAGELFKEVLDLVQPLQDQTPTRRPRPGRWCWEPWRATSTTSARTCSPPRSAASTSR